MGSYTREIQQNIRRFKTEGGKAKYTPKEIARWMIENGLWGVPTGIAIKKCAEDVAHALHEMQTVDPSGNKVRTEYVLYSEEGKQLPIWANWTKLTRKEMEYSFKGLRKGVLADCKRLKAHVDSYNEYVNPHPDNPIQMGFDFTFELQILELAERDDPKTNETFAIEPERPSRRLRVAARRSASRRALSRP